VMTGRRMACSLVVPDATIDFRLDSGNPALLKGARDPLQFVNERFGDGD
jgi:hypothetical protein